MVSTRSVTPQSIGDCGVKSQTLTPQQVRGDSFLVLSICVLAIFFTFNVFAQAPKIDSKQPIEITADALEVQQNERQAIFSGNVIANQGGIRMTSQRMIVHYKAGGDGGGAGNADSAVKGISKIEADGGVFFTSARESAKGSSAVYDVDAERITMVGDVSLTRDQNIVKGSQLVYNLKTGRSVLSSGGVGATNQNGRVKGLFVPNQGQ